MVLGVEKRENNLGQKLSGKESVERGELLIRLKVGGGGAGDLEREDSGE